MTNIAKGRKAKYELYGKGGMIGSIIKMGNMQYKGPIKKKQHILPQPELFLSWVNSLTFWFLSKFSTAQTCAPVDNSGSSVIPKLILPLKICGERENFKCDSTGIWENDRIEFSGKIIENSPMRTLPSAWVKVPESSANSGKLWS